MVRQETSHTILVNLLQEGSFCLPMLWISQYCRIGLNEKEFMLLVHIQIFHEKKEISFPTVSQLADVMSISESEVIQGLQELVHKGCLAIEQYQEKGIQGEKYSITPFLQQIAASYLEDTSTVPNENTESYMKLFQLFEREMGRLLSPFECENLSQWLSYDQYSEELIVAALKEALYCKKLSFRYIDRILLDWQQNQIKTAEQAAEYSQKFRSKNPLYTNFEEKDVKSSFFLYDWVNKN